MTTNYFKNCRGATLNPTYANEWEKSGNFPRVTSPFVPYSTKLNAEVMYFCGSTKVSTWIHFNLEEVTKQISYLKSIGVNLIRIYSDFYCWAADSFKYLQKMSNIADICEQKKIYTQWVLFDGFTDGDVSANGFDLGHFDPSTIPMAVSWGLKRWQRCPTISQHSLLTRSPSSMVVSGDKYVEQVVDTVKQYRTTKVWEVMHDVNILPNEPSGYQFIASAINKVRSLIPSHQKITFSVKNLNNFSSTLNSNTTTVPDIYSSGVVKVLTPLVDHVCYIDNGSGYLSKAYNYFNAYKFSLDTGKPIFALQSFNKSLDPISNSINYFSGLGVGFITEGMIDRNYGNKPFNNSNGIFFDDGEIRDSKITKAFIDKTISDGFISVKKLNTNLIQKINYSSQTNDYIPEKFTRLEKFKDVGANLFRSMIDAKELFSEYREVFRGFAPSESSKNSKLNGWFASGMDLSSKSKITYSLSSFNTILLNPDNRLAYSNTTSGQIMNDREAYSRINTLTLLHESIPFYLGHNFYNSIKYGVGLIASSNQILASSYGGPFLPYSNQKLNVSCVTPYIGSQRYFSGVANLSGPYRDELSNCQKPVCYYMRGETFPTGACYILPNIEINEDVNSVQNVLQYLDWDKYNLELAYWSFYLILSFADFELNLKNTVLNLYGSENKIYKFLVLKSDN